MIKILLDNLTIQNPIRTFIHKSIDSVADMFNFDIANTADAHTSLFKQTKGQKLSISIQRVAPGLTGASRDFISIFSGLCDTAEFHYHPTQIIRCIGRDYTGLLIDEITTPSLAEKFTNKSASEIANLIAKQYGFKTDITRTTATDLDDKLYSPGTRVWSVITELAQKSSFDCYITKNKTLVFKKRELSSAVKRTYLIPSPNSGTFKPLNSGTSCPANFQFQKDITDSLAFKVEVIGFDPKTKQRMSYIAESPQRNRDNYKIITETHLELKTKSDVKLCAENKLKEYSKNLITGSFTIPLDPELEPADSIQLKSNPQSPTPKPDSSWSGIYFITDIEHESSVDGETTTVSFSSKPLSSAKTKEQTFPSQPQTFKL